MPPSFEILKTKFMALLVAIAEHLDDKLDKTSAAVSANKLTSPFTLSLSGDGSASVNIDGSAAANAVFTLSNSGVSAGVYPKVTVDAKGRVTGGELLLAADIPSLDASKVGTGVFDPQRIPLPTKLSASRTITMTGDGDWSVSGDLGGNLSGAMTLANTGVVAGTYSKVTVDSKGRITAGGPLLASDVPVLNQNTTGTADVAKKVVATAAIDSFAEIIRVSMAGNDHFRVIAGGSLDNGYVEFSTADNATESIFFRQYSGSFVTLVRTLVLLDGSGNSQFPGTITAQAFSGNASSAAKLATARLINGVPFDGTTDIELGSIAAMPVNEYVTIAADAVKQYDLQTLLGAAFADFDIKTAEICVRARDTTVGSPLNGAYANAEAVSTYGIKDERYVMVSNQSGASLDFYIKVLVHPVAS